MKKISFFCDPMMAIEAMIGFPLFVVMLLLVFYTPLDFLYFQKMSWVPAPIWEKIIFAMFCFAGVIIGIIFSPLVFFPLMARIELDEEGIRLKQPFKKYSKIPYSHLNFFRLAFYNHGGHTRYFVVMSQYAVSQDELLRINRVQNSDTLVKVKLTKKNYKKLCEILPENRRTILKNALNGGGKDGVFNAEAYMKQKMRQEKSKRRKKK